MPYVAQWRVDFTRDNGLTDSWEMLLKDKTGDGYIKPSWVTDGGGLSSPSRTATGEVDPDAYKPGGPASDRVGPDRKKWITVLGKFQYPAWSDRDGNGFIQPLGQRGIKHQGAVLLFPLHRLAETPVHQYTVVDVMRKTLGVGPCRYILDVEGQRQEHIGRATCHVRTLLNGIYGEGTQKARREDIGNYLGDALDFVTHIRDRIDAYVAFGRQVRTYIASQRRVYPELKGFLDEMESLAREIDEKVKKHQGMMMKKQPVLQKIETRLSGQNARPTTRELVEELNRDFVETLIDYTGSDWKARIKAQYTDPLTRVGGQQDSLVGACRWVVKTLRQRAGMATALDPRVAPVAAEIRARCQKVLRGGAAYEGARH